MERQADAAERWCHANGHTLNADLHLSDAGLSAFKDDHLSKGALGRFLDMAQSGDLSETPVLLVEAIDRLSRLEAIDGLQYVLLALVRAGVAIVTLEDGAEYSRATLREDGSKLIVMAMQGLGVGKTSCSILESLTLDISFAARNFSGFSRSPIRLHLTGPNIIAAPNKSTQRIKNWHTKPRHF